MTSVGLARKIARLPEAGAITLRFERKLFRRWLWNYERERKKYSSQKTHWIRWLSEYGTAGVLQSKEQARAFCGNRLQTHRLPANASLAMRSIEGAGKRSSFGNERCPCGRTKLSSAMRRNSKNHRAQTSGSACEGNVAEATESASRGAGSAGGGGRAIACLAGGASERTGTV
jgi:hypothetical protein